MRFFRLHQRKARFNSTPKIEDVSFFKTVFQNLSSVPFSQQNYSTEMNQQQEELYEALKHEVSLLEADMTNLEQEVIDLMTEIMSNFISTGTLDKYYTFEQDVQKYIYKIRCLVSDKLSPLLKSYPSLLVRLKGSNSQEETIPCQHEIAQLIQMAHNALSLARNTFKPLDCEQYTHKSLISNSKRCQRESSRLDNEPVLEQTSNDNLPDYVSSSYRLELYQQSPKFLKPCKLKSSPYLDNQLSSNHFVENNTNLSKRNTRTLESPSYSDNQTLDYLLNEPKTLTSDPIIILDEEEKTPYDQDHVRQERIKASLQPIILVDRELPSSTQHKSSSPGIEDTQNLVFDDKHTYSWRKVAALKPTQYIWSFYKPNSNHKTLPIRYSGDNWEMMTPADYSLIQGSKRRQSRRCSN